MNEDENGRLLPEVGGEYYDHYGKFVCVTWGDKGLLVRRDDGRIEAMTLDDWRRKYDEEHN